MCINFDRKVNIFKSIKNKQLIEFSCSIS
ncbi:hypothetical protein CY0110_17302 [Crocosphaera chwakensis CCY0110]|uniref:Uncharacterized protein n=1 Tax=Crocosphaera chwakensis CCY0110 TaxID=391612 RepID=A3IIE2_9CHRO|nr:hypothetical protein CY0110_17302 [Crocosphaera chwakensis CCY0110]